MNAVRGRVRGSHVEIDEPLPEGAEVIVLLRQPLTAEDRARIAASRTASPDRFVSHEQVQRELDERRRGG
jgi:hypothetical protein